MTMRESSGATELNVDIDLVRLIVAKGRAALSSMPDAEDDEPLSETDIGFTNAIVEEDPVHLSEEAAPDATRVETSAMIDSLNVDEQAELIALTWIGRGDFAPEELEEAVREAKARAKGPASGTLFSMEVFPSHLANGLDAWLTWADAQPE